MGSSKRRKWRDAAPLRTYGKVDLSYPDGSWVTFSQRFPIDPGEVARNRALDTGWPEGSGDPLVDINAAIRKRGPTHGLYIPTFLAGMFRNEIDLLDVNSKYARLLEADSCWLLERASAMARTSAMSTREALEHLFRLVSAQKAQQEPTQVKTPEEFERLVGWKPSARLFEPPSVEVLKPGGKP